MFFDAGCAYLCVAMRMTAHRQEVSAPRSEGTAAAGRRDLDEGSTRVIGSRGEVGRMSCPVRNLTRWERSPPTRSAE
jgi:hypothetical protein